MRNDIKFIIACTVMYILGMSIGSAINDTKLKEENDLLRGEIASQVLEIENKDNCDNNVLNFNEVISMLTNKR